MTIKTIPTKYKGILFRSKLEAQWAKFFDSLGIEWIYEPEGFEFENGIKYLPDFYLPKQDCFFEVKGLMSDLDREKIEELAYSGISKQVVIGFANGEIELYEDESKIAYNLGIHNCNETLCIQNYFKDECDLAYCHNCKKYFFYNLEGSWFCRNCGYYDGNKASELYDFQRLSRIDVRENEEV